VTITNFETSEDNGHDDNFRVNKSDRSFHFVTVSSMSGSVTHKNGEALATPTQSQSQQQEESSPSCLDASLSMLHSSMERANAYEYLLHKNGKEMRTSEGSGNRSISSNGGGGASTEGHSSGSQQKAMRSVASLVRAADGLGHFPFDPTTSTAVSQREDEHRQASTGTSSSLLRETTGNSGSPSRASTGNSITSPPAATADQKAHASWWLKVLHRQEREHEKERKLWQQNLQEAQNHSKEYKNELKDSLQGKLELLERQKRSHSSTSKRKKRTGANGEEEDSVPSVSRASTGTTHSTASSVAGEEEASTAGLEVTYESSQFVRKLGDLELTYEETVRQHETEREEWVEKLDRAAAVTADGHKLSETMHNQLLDFAEEIQNGNAKQRRQWKERVKALEHLVELTEQQHKMEKEEWQQEKDVLETTVNRLASNVQQQATELEDVAYENQTLENTVAQLVADKDSLQSDQVTALSKHYQTEKGQWQTENCRLLNTVARLTAENQKQSAELNEKHNGTSALNNSVAQLVADRSSLRAKCAKLQEKLRSASRSGSPVNVPPIVHTGSSSAPSPRRLEWDDKLDRAIIERDLYWQEAEKAKSLLEEVETLHAREKEEWVRQQNKKENDRYADTRRQLQELRAQQATQIEKLEQEVDTSSTDIHKRYQQSVEKRSELGSRIQTLEKQHSGEKHSWKLRLEAAVHESRTSQDKRRALERELELLESKQVEIIDEWHNRLDTFKIAADDELEELRNQHAAEIEEIRSERIMSRDDIETEINRLNTEHGAEVKTWKAKLETLEADHAEEVQSMVARTNELESKLEELHTQYSTEKMKWESKHDQQISESDNCKRELEIYRDTSSVGLTADFKDHQRAVCEAVEELRLDVMSIRETLDFTAKTDQMLESSRHSEVRQDLEHIQESLNDAVAEITLETEAMLESRTAVKTLAVDLAKTFPSKEDQTRSLEFQEKVAEELIDVRDQLSKLIEFDSSRQVAVQEACHLQFESQLQMKEMALETCKARLKQTKAELVAERTRRKKPKRRAGPSLNGQMNVQATNDNLEVTLNEAGMDEINGAGTDQENGDPSCMYYDDDDSSDGSNIYVTTSEDTSSPMLEEALALAHGLTDIVHGRGDHNKETSVMEMLESLSEMMDHADRVKGQSEDRGDLGSGAAAKASTSTPMGHLSARQEQMTEVSDSPPAPVTTPMLTRSSKPASGSLQMVVEQMNQRCQLLERERTDLMEVTLNLLESARESNAAELDAALATFRENSSQELKKVKERNQSDMARLYTRLCGSCKHGILLTGIANEEC
jgi:hypothetical protein